MRNNKVISLVLIFSLFDFGYLPKCWSGQNPGNAFPEAPTSTMIIPSATPTKEENPLTAGTKATLGRVFGVQGQGGEIAYYSVDMFNHTPANASWRSTLIPGWGQIFNDQKSKGYLMMGTVFVTGISSILIYQKSRDSFDAYKSNGFKNGSKYDDYSRQRNQSIVLGSVAALIWGFSIFDAHAHAYNALWSSDSHEIELAAEPEGAKILWHERF